ncbi:MAG: helix-turn-helix transcriptional regulator [Alphaproteobacteria bacterium]
MKRLKALRQSGNYTQQQLAEKLKTTQQTIARWESGKAEPSMSDLRDLAMIFSTSVDDLLDVNPFSDKVATNHLCFSLAGRENITDGFWGHIGLLLPGQEKVKWFPITLQTANEVSSALAKIAKDEEWLCISTLNNRMLAFNPNKLRHIYLLDDASDMCNAWNDEAKVDYNGQPLEFYRGLDAWASHDEDWEETSSAAYREVIEEFVKERGMDEEDTLAFLHHSTVYTVDGISKSYWANAQRLSNVIFEIEMECLSKIVAIHAEGGDFESYYPQANLAAIEMPLIDLIDAAKEELKELEGAAA